MEKEKLRNRHGLVMTRECFGQVEGLVKLSLCGPFLVVSAVGCPSPIPSCQDGLEKSHMQIQEIVAAESNGHSGSSGVGKNLGEVWVENPG